MSRNIDNELEETKVRTIERKGVITISEDIDEQLFSEAVDQMLKGQATLESVYRKVPEHDLGLSLINRLIYRIDPWVYLK